MLTEWCSLQQLHDDIQVEVLFECLVVPDHVGVTQLLLHHGYLIEEPTHALLPLMLGFPHERMSDLDLKEMKNKKNNK